MVRRGAALGAAMLAGCESPVSSGENGTPTPCRGDAGRPPRAYLDGGISEFDPAGERFSGTAFLDFEREVDALERYGVALTAYDPDGAVAFEVDFGDFTEETARTMSFETERFPIVTVPTWEGTQAEDFRCTTPETRAVVRGYHGYHETPFTEWPRTSEHDFETATGHVWSSLAGRVEERGDPVALAVWLAKCQQRMLGRDAGEALWAVPDATWLAREETYTVTCYPSDAPDGAEPPAAVPEAVRELGESNPDEPVRRTLSRSAFAETYAAAEGDDEPGVPSPDGRYARHAGHCTPGTASAAYAFADDEGGFDLVYEWAGMDDEPPDRASGLDGS